MARHTGDPGGHALVEVLDFLDGVGYLVKRKLLDAGTVWHGMGYWIQRYVPADRLDIEQVRGLDGAQWAELIWLSEELTRFARRRGIDTGPCPEANLREYFQDEQALVPRPPFRPIVRAS